MLKEFFDAIFSDKGMSFTLYASVAVIISGIIVICVSICISKKRAYEKENVAICSSRLRAIKKLNKQYQECFFDINPSTVYKKSVNTRAQAEQFNFDTYMNEQIGEHFDELSQLVREVNSNKNKQHEYLESIKKAKSLDPAQDIIDSGVPAERYLDIEKKLINRAVLRPECDSQVVLVVSYISPQGRSTYRRHKNYSIDQLETELKEYQTRQENISFSNIERKKMTPKLRYQVMRRDGHRCVICGRSAKDGVKLEVDHIFPVSKGGKTELNNLRTLCMDCNRGKGSEFIEYGIN